MSFGVAGNSPPISTASPSPPGSAGSFKPMAAPIPPPAVASSGSWARSAQEQLRPARPRRSDQVVAGSRRPVHLWRMPSRSPQRLPPRSPPRSPDRSAPSRTPRLAGRAGSRHGHPLPDTHDNKAEQPAETRAVCQLPEDDMTENQSGCLVPHHTTRSRGRLGRCRAPGHPDNYRICRTRRRPFELPRSAYVTGSRAGPGTRPQPGVRFSRTRRPSGESSSCRAVSQPYGLHSPRVP